MWCYGLSGLHVQSAVRIPFAVPVTSARKDPDVVIEHIPTLDQPTGVQKQGKTYIVGRSDFLFRPHKTLAFRIRPNSIQIEIGPNVPDNEVLTYLLGSAWGVLCHLRSLLPLHCSAVATADQIFAFAGRMGAGKSSMAVALALRGLDHAGDDIIVARVTNRIAINGLPKGVKLDQERAANFDLPTGAPVGAETGNAKFYIDGPFRQNSGPFSRMQIYVLDVGSEASIKRLDGAEKFAGIYANLFRRSWMGALRPKENIFADTARLAKMVDVFRFTRPRDLDRFADGVDLIEDHIRSQA